MAKDVRRGLHEIIRFHKALVEGDTEFYNRGSQYELGGGAVNLPELREVLASQGVNLPKNPKVRNNTYTTTNTPPRNQSTFLRRP